MHFIKSKCDKELREQLADLITQNKREETFQELAGAGGGGGGGAETHRHLEEGTKIYPPVPSLPVQGR